MSNPFLINIPTKAPKLDNVVSKTVWLTRNLECTRIYDAYRWATEQEDKEAAIAEFDAWFIRKMNRLNKYSDKASEGL